ncbi:hypothetical protein BDZ45DRAFT_799003 [Acephala macrosclerotiorum]|nr:hypothetical protein BDZ45DRAFT_799003 [Acephala macrosclerotiorum]
MVVIVESPDRCGKSFREAGDEGVVAEGVAAGRGVDEAAGVGGCSAATAFQQRRRRTTILFSINSSHTSGMTSPGAAEQLGHGTRDPNLPQLLSTTAVNWIPLSTAQSTPVNIVPERCDTSAIDVENGSGVFGAMESVDYMDGRVSTRDDADQGGNTEDSCRPGSAPIAENTCTTLVLYRRPRSYGTFHPFPRLHEDLKVLVLQASLLANGPITNPCVWNKAGSGEGQESNSEEYQCSFGLNLNVLAASKEMNRLGIDVLYKHNQFRFTRRVSSRVGQTTTTRSILLFLSQIVTTFDENRPATQQTVGRLIKEVVLQDSDLESDMLAEKGFGRVLSSQHQSGTAPESISLRWSLAVLRRLSAAGSVLNNLVITIDEEEPGVWPALGLGMLGRHILDVARPIYGTKPANMTAAERERLRNAASLLTHEYLLGRTVEWNLLMHTEEQQANLFLQLPFFPEQGKVAAALEKLAALGARFEGLDVTNDLKIRGITDPVDDAHRASPRGSLIFEAFGDWMLSNKVRTSDFKFSPITERRLAEDGSLMPARVAADILATSNQQDLSFGIEDEDDAGIDGLEQASRTVSAQSDNILQLGNGGGEGVDVALWASGVAESVAEDNDPLINRVQRARTSGPYVATGDLYALLGQDLPEHRRRPTSLANTRGYANEPYISTGDLYELLGQDLPEHRPFTFANTRAAPSKPNIRSEDDKAETYSNRSWWSYSNDGHGHTDDEMDDSNRQDSFDNESSENMEDREVQEGNTGEESQHSGEW